MNMDGKKKNNDFVEYWKRCELGKMWKGGG